MTPEEFAKGITITVSDSCARSVIETLTEGPSGRRPSQNLVALSTWFSTLTKEDHENITKVVKLAAETATFNFLVVLDGAATIENDPNKGHLELYHVRDGIKALLNDRRQPLHDMYIISSVI